MKTNWNAIHRIQMVKMKDDRFITIDRGDINQIKKLHRAVLWGRVFGTGQLYT